MPMRSASAAHGDGGRAGVDHEVHRAPVDGALRHEMAAAVAGSTMRLPLPPPGPAADADGRIHAQRDALAARLDLACPFASDTSLTP